jgi:hypothetical protein
MSRLHFGFYLTVGLALLILGIWRFGEGRTRSGLRHGGLVIGIVILSILAASQLGIVCLDGVEECLNHTRSRRSRYFVCLFHARFECP